MWKLEVLKDKRLKMLPTYENPSDEEAGGDEGPGVQRLRGKGRNQRQELHRLQGEGSQDTNHPGLDERGKLNDDPPLASQMGPGMVQQSQAVCGECDGRGEIIPPSSRSASLASLASSSAALSLSALSLPVLSSASSASSTPLSSQYLTS